ncbi:MAG: hypothetical protein IIY70_04655 [Oscillospiraceae bacterium]|nr:hypothetical protein [Oscillospiraceae bacterium]
MSDYRTIRISGVGKEAGDRYDELDISGMGSIQGALQCNAAKIFGSLTVAPHVTVQERIKR